MLFSKHKILADPLPGLLTPTLQLCPREVKPKPERRELSQLLNLSTHPQHYPLKINHAGKLQSQTLALYVSAHAPHSAGSSLETFPSPFQEADVRMAAVRRDAFASQCGYRYSHSRRYGGEVRCVRHLLQLPRAVKDDAAQSWKHVISAISTAYGFILSNFRIVSWTQIKQI